MITPYFLSKGMQEPVTEYVEDPPGYRMFNTGGVEVEVGEFLYSLVHLIKAKRILETGTHLGISSVYMGQAIKELKNEGSIITLEVIPQLRDEALKLFQKLELENIITSILHDSRTYTLPSISEELDILFLDSEPQYRFDEFLKYWNFVKPNGLILIHDMNNKIGHTGTFTQIKEDSVPIYDWPYGDFREKIGPLISKHEVQIISFQTPRGLTIFQKCGDNSEIKKFLQRTDKSNPMPEGLTIAVQRVMQHMINTILSMKKE